jgi:hypothetical protein
MGSVTYIYFMSKYNEILAGLLRSDQYLLGSELLEKLVANSGVKLANGRKIIQRASEKGLLLSSKPLSFGKGQ